MREKQWFWATLTLSSITIVSVVFAAWELVENHFFRDATYLTLHYLYMTRGIASSLVLAFWAAWFVLRLKRRADEEQRRARERMLEIEKLTSMGKMAAGTAHHLNSPLAALLLRVELMREGAPEGMAEDFARLETGLKFCSDFVRRLLDFTRTTPVRKQPERIGPLVDSVAGFFLPVIHSRQATLEVDTAPAGNLEVYADRNLLETVLLILLSNALDAVPAGGRIAIRCIRSAPGAVSIEVSDNGAGFSATYLGRAFEPFFTTKEPGKGTGLGLAIARNAVLEHGGAMRLGAREGGGAVVAVELPLAIEEVPV